MKNLNKKQGFTFMELLLSVIIIGVIASGLALGVPSAFMTTQETAEISNAAELAGKYIETLKSNLSVASQYDSATAGTTAPIELSAQYTGNDYYTVTTEITNLESETIDGVAVTTLKEIDVVYKKTGDTKILANISTILARPR